MDLPTKRYIRLINELGHGRARGWQSAVAALLGENRSYISRVLNKKRGVTVDSIERASRNLGIRSEYFYAGGEEDIVSYRDFRNPDANLTEVMRERLRSIADDASPSGWAIAASIALEAEAQIGANYRDRTQVQEAARRVLKVLKEHPVHQVFEIARELESNLERGANPYVVLPNVGEIAHLLSELAAAELAVSPDPDDSP